MGVLICDLSVDSEALGMCLHLSGYDIASIKLTPKIASINLPDWFWRELKIIICWLILDLSYWFVFSLLFPPPLNVFLRWLQKREQGSKGKLMKSVNKRANIRIEMCKWTHLKIPLPWGEIPRILLNSCAWIVKTQDDQKVKYLSWDLSQISRERTICTACPRSGDKLKLPWSINIKQTPKLS